MNQLNVKRHPEIGRVNKPLETSGGQSSNQHLSVVHFFNTSVNMTSVAA
jgi:hypothetical protein